MTNLSQIKSRAEHEWQEGLLHFKTTCNGRDCKYKDAGINTEAELFGSIVDHIHAATVEECIGIIEDAKEVHGMPRELLGYIEGRLQALITEPEV